MNFLNKININFFYLILSICFALFLVIILLIYSYQNLNKRFNNLKTEFQVLQTNQDVKKLTPEINFQTYNINEFIKTNFSFEKIIFQSKFDEAYCNPYADNYIENIFVFLSQDCKIIFYDLDAKKILKSERLSLHEKIRFMQNKISNIQPGPRDLKIYKDMETEKSFILLSMNEFVTKNDKNYFSIKVYKSEIRENFQLDDFNLIYQTSSIYSKDYTDFNMMASGGKLLVSNDKKIFYLSIGDFATKSLSTYGGRSAEQPYGGIIQFNLENNKITQIAKGLRNSQGICFDPETNIFATDHGPNGGDEVNLIKEDKFYGWPFSSEGVHYPSKKDKFPNLNIIHSNSFNLEPPLIAFVPSIGISDLICIKDNIIIIASMKSQALLFLEYQNEKIIFTRYYDLKHRIRDLLIVDKKLIIVSELSYENKTKIKKNDYFENLIFVMPLEELI